MRTILYVRSRQSNGIGLLNFEAQKMVKMIRDFGAIGARNPRTFDTYDGIGDMTYMSIYNALKFYLHGYSRVTDNLSRERRFGRITREDAVTLEKYYQSEYPRQNIQMFLDWLGMGYGSFVWYAERIYAYAGVRV